MKTGFFSCFFVSRVYSSMYMVPGTFVPGVYLFPLYMKPRTNTPVAMKVQAAKSVTHVKMRLFCTLHEGVVASRRQKAGKALHFILSWSNLVSVFPWCNHLFRVSKTESCFSCSHQRSMIPVFPLCI